MKRYQFLWLMAAFIMACFLLTGCGKDLSSNKQHRIVATELSRQYIGLYEQYTTLENNLPDKYLDDLRNLAAPMDHVKRLLTTYNDFVLAGQENTEKAKEVRIETQALISDLAQQIADIALEVYYESQ